MFSLIFIAGYLLGSIPTGFLVARAKGVDIRQVGSGNIGATNAFRVLGKGPGFLVLLVDAIKGFAACVWLPAWGHALGWLPSDLPVSSSQWFPIMGGVAAVIGHNYTCWLRFKGGKGIATSAGVLVGLVPGAFLFVLGVFLITVILTRYVSLGSILAALALPIATYFTHKGPILTGVTLMLSVLAIYKHRANIERLLNGTENRIGGRF